MISNVKRKMEISLLRLGVLWMTIKNAFPATRTGGTLRKISFSTTC
jgi:hypothetical protein